MRVRLIQKEGIKLFNPSFLFDEGSTISWIPCGRKLTCSFPGIKFFYGPDTYYGEEVSFAARLMNLFASTTIGGHLLERWEEASGRLECACCHVDNMVSYYQLAMIWLLQLSLSATGLAAKLEAFSHGVGKVDCMQS